MVELASSKMQNFVNQGTGTLLIYPHREEEINIPFTPGTSNVSLDYSWMQPMHCVFLKLTLHEVISTDIFIIY